MAEKNIHDAVQGHSRSVFLVLIENPCVISYSNE